MCMLYVVDALSLIVTEMVSQLFYQECKGTPVDNSVSLFICVEKFSITQIAYWPPLCGNTRWQVLNVCICYMNQSLGCSNQHITFTV